MYLDTKGFKKAFLEATDCFGAGDYAAVESIIGEAPEEEREALREEFFLDQRIMTAKSFEEVKDITLEQILSCLKSHGVFFELYEGMKAAHYFERIGHIGTLRTCRKRRIL